MFLVSDKTLLFVCPFYCFTGVMKMLLNTLKEQLTDLGKMFTPAPTRYWAVVP